ncbi:MAG: PAC2 family protein [Nitrospinota bacterium]
MPTLKDAVLILAFAGWNDASGVATTSVSFMVDKVSGKRFAGIDPEDFYNFIETRPTVRLEPGKLQREILWPANDFFFCQEPGLSRSLVLGLGVEPHLRWRGFAEAVLRLSRECRVEQVITLGALLAEVAHSRPVRLTGFASDPALTARLGLVPSRYEGPTGIVGVLNDAFRREGLPVMSLWANVPHYLSVTFYPKAALALLGCLSSYLELPLDLTDLEAASRDFDAQAKALLEKNEELSAYVKKLEEGAETSETPSPPEEKRQSGEELARELEQFLRERRRRSD